ncbi:MAG: hypothetical protein CVU79_00205 [Elusimicrobia bacterium HGW-Elusimicrobia-3]|nr:MAG: hypothetical protein CVU79_00205 [Elusimicrobia bacterium HGW-Elusimicrobia-3]
MKIRHIPCQPHCFAFGGFELQMLATIEATRKCGVDVAPLDFWEREADFDIIHAWGLINYYALYWAKKGGKRIVVTALLSNPESISEKARFYLSRVFGTIRSRLRVASLVDAIVVVNEQDALDANRYYGISKGKIHVIPHILDNVFLSDAFSEQNMSSYIHCSGNICQRKNQLNLAIACARLGEKAVFTGNVLPGEDRYADELKNVIKNNPGIVWHGGFSENSPELLKICRESSIYALPSFNEKQPISALEAVALGKPILLGDRAYARQKCYKGARLVNPASISSIEDGLKDIRKNSSIYCVPKKYISACSEENVGKAYRAVYESLLT